MDNLVGSFPNLTAMTRARISPDILKFARSKFPEISNELIEQNICEFITAQDAEHKCGSCCVGIEMCQELINTAGYTYVMNLQANG